MWRKSWQPGQRIVTQRVWVSKDCYYPSVIHRFASERRAYQLGHHRVYRAARSRCELGSDSPRGSGRDPRWSVWLPKISRCPTIWPAPVSLPGSHGISPLGFGSTEAVLHEEGTGEGVPRVETETDHTVSASLCPPRMRMMKPDHRPLEGSTQRTIAELSCEIQDTRERIIRSRTPTCQAAGWGGYDKRGT